MSAFDPWQSLLCPCKGRGTAEGRYQPIAYIYKAAFGVNRYASGAKRTNSPKAKNNGADGGDYGRAEHYALLVRERHHCRADASCSGRPYNRVPYQLICLPVCDSSRQQKKGSSVKESKSQDEERKSEAAGQQLMDEQ